jgi:L-fucose isomerase
MLNSIWNRNEFPKVGIRPVIDGRCNGVREALEDQTMNMAKSAAKLITETLRYPDGSPVQCILPSFTIGGCMEAMPSLKKRMSGSPSA